MQSSTKYADRCKSWEQSVRKGGPQAHQPLVRYQMRDLHWGAGGAPSGTTANLIVEKARCYGHEGQSAARVSVTYTALIFSGLTVMLIGVVLAALGGPIATELSLGELQVKTTSLGLALGLLGAGVATMVALNLPEGVTVLEPTGRSALDHLWTRRRS